MRSILTASILLWCSSPDACAAVFARAIEVGDDVLIEASGSFNTDGVARLFSPALATGVLRGTSPTLIVGEPDQVSVHAYRTIVSPPVFGPSSEILLPDYGQGDLFGVDVTLIVVPLGYVSGDPLSAAMTFSDSSLADLNLLPGTYVWSWGTEDNADFFELSVVPEPTHSIFLLIGGGMYFGCRRRRVRGQLSNHTTQTKTSDFSVCGHEFFQDFGLVEGGMNAKVPFIHSVSRGQVIIGKVGSADLPCGCAIHEERDQVKILAIRRRSLPFINQ